MRTLRGPGELRQATGRRGEIVFVSGRAGSRGVYVVGADGRGRRQVLSVDRWANPKWSPHRKWIAFYREDLFVVRADGAKLQRVPTYKGYEGPDDLCSGCMPAWSPDGGWLAYEFGNGGIAVRSMRTGSTRVLRCEHDDYFHCDFLCSCGAPAWAPSSSRIAYWFANTDPKPRVRDA